MTPRSSAVLLVAAWTALVGSGLGSPALAQGPQTGGVKITGSVTTNTSIDGSTNLASGTNARAITSVGSIHDSVDGELDVTVQTGQIATVAGPGQQAITSVGSVHEGSKLSGHDEIVVSTGQIINMSDRSGRPACVVVGSTGDVPGC
jgi:hypothetical protein